MSLPEGYRSTFAPGEPLQSAPPGKRVDLGPLLEDTRRFFCRHVVVGDLEADAVALWVAHTYVFQTARATPYLNFWSPEVGSGKTTGLEVLEVLCRAGLTADDLSGPALFRLVEARRPTLLFDEVDAVFGKKNSDSADDLRKILNSGYKAGKRVFRCGGKNMSELQEFDPFCPKATAGLNELPGTLAHRSIPIAMKPPLPSEQYEDFDPEEVEQESAAIRARFEAWAESAEEALRDPGRKPVKLHELDARRNEIWRILFRIADLAGGRWPAAARSAALALSSGERRNDEASLGVKLLADIRELLIEEKFTARTLVEALNALEESPWGGWRDGAGLTTRLLGWKLKPYGIFAKPIRIHGERAGNGYVRAQFEDAWSRYLPNSGTGTGTTGTTGSQIQKTGEKEPVQKPVVPVVETPAIPHEQRDVPVVPVSNPFPGDDGFLDFIAAVHSAGHITTGEALERERMQKLVHANREPF